MDALIDPKDYSPEHIEMLLSKYNTSQRSYLEKCTAYLDLETAYRHLQGKSRELENKLASMSNGSGTMKAEVKRFDRLEAYAKLKISHAALQRKYEELVSKMAKDTCVEDLSKGVENFNFDDDPKSEVNFYKEKFKLVQCSNGALKANLMSRERELSNSNANLIACQKKCDELKEEIMRQRGRYSIAERGGRGGGRGMAVTRIF